MSNRFSEIVTVFHERVAPEEGYLAGYAALINQFELLVPVPDVLSLISRRHKQYHTDEWRVFTPRHQPENTLTGHLTFALKYEGVELGLLKKLFLTVPPDEWIQLITREPTGQYSRKIWFLYEWLLDGKLDIPNATIGNYVDLVDTNIQFGLTEAIKSPRHRIRNNLPGTREFCPMIRKTAVLEEHIQQGFSGRVAEIMGKIHPDIMARAAAFLLLKDSKASYAIEGESPPQNRAQRWGRAIGQAGRSPISKEELLRLQQIVIDNPRFTKMGFRDQEGFIGEHDRRYGTPIPDHISARRVDLDPLMSGLIATDRMLEKDPGYDAVLAAAVVAFGFVFIHPFVDGNGRIHRYLIHHVLHRKGYVAQGMIFPVSSVILEKLDEYRKVLEVFSFPRLDLIQWEPDTAHNVAILNETIDLYRYFDATRQAEFLYRCVRQTIEEVVPAEVEYLEKYDRMKDHLDNYFEMPDKTVALLIRFLEQGNGQLSERARSREFKALTDREVLGIEEKFREAFLRR